MLRPDIDNLASALPRRPEPSHELAHAQAMENPAKIGHIVEKPAKIGNNVDQYWGTGKWY